MFLGHAFQFSTNKRVKVIYSNIGFSHFGKKIPYGWCVRNAWFFRLEIIALFHRGFPFPLFDMLPVFLYAQTRESDRDRHVLIREGLHKDAFAMCFA